MRKITKIGNNMITLQEAINLAAEAHNGQYRKSIKVFPVNEHTLKNHELTKLQQNNGSDFSICKEDGKYTMDIHLQLFIAKPYITHPLVVMNMMNTDEEKIIAVLHDVFENNKTFEIKCDIENNWYINTPDSKSVLISTNIGKALTSLTNNLHLRYEEYIIDITLNKVATKIKIADIVCNLADNPSEYAKEKYLKALPILLKGL